MIKRYFLLGIFIFIDKTVSRIRHMVRYIWSRDVREDDAYSLVGTLRLTLLILLPERKYGRWPNTEAYYWWSQWEGSVSKPLHKARRKHTQINLCWHAKILNSTDSLRADFPFHQLFSSSSPSSNQNQLKRLGFDMLSLNPCLIWLTGGLVSCCGADAHRAGRENSGASEDSPLSRKAIIRN